MHVEKMNKKAQPASQIFTYIIAIVIVGVILIFGYSAVRTFVHRSDQITIVKFQKELETAVKTVSNDYGTVKKYNFDLSNDYKQVCFVRNYDKASVASGFIPANFQQYPVIWDSIYEQVDKNIFLIKSNRFVAEKLLVGVVSLPNTEVFKCLNVSNARLSVKMEGMGDHVVISESK
jgi:hypothetical protein